MSAPLNVEILQRVLDAQTNGFDQDAARLVLRWQFSAADQARVHELSTRARSGSLTAVETEELDSYLFIADLLSILHSKARVALRERSNAA